MGFVCKTDVGALQGVVGAIGCDCQNSYTIPERWEERAMMSIDCGNNLVYVDLEERKEREEREDDSPHNLSLPTKQGVLEGQSNNCKNISTALIKEDLEERSNDCVDSAIFEGWKGDLEGMSIDCLDNIIL